MKKLVCMFAMSLMLVGCAGISKQNNINEQMKEYSFKSSPKAVYKAAEEVFKGMYVPLESTGKNMGASQWMTKHSELGTKKYQEKSRFTVKVAAKNKMTTIQVYYESQSNFSGNWKMRTPSRYLTYEYKVLQKINPDEAKKLEKLASVK